MDLVFKKVSYLSFSLPKLNQATKKNVFSIDIYLHADS
jgi:hypothetical protein